MTKKSSTSLQHYARKTLWQRLVIMTLVITLIVSTLVYVLEHRRMQDYVVDEATNAVRQIVARARNIMQENKIDRYKAFQQALAERVATPEQRQTGDFLYAGFFNPNGELIDEYVETEIMDGNKLKSHFISQPLIRPAIDSYHVQSDGLDSQSYIYVVFPIVDLQQQVAAYTHAVFALSDTTQAQLQNTIWRAVIITILIVLATSLLLYPVILRLVKRLTQFSANLLDANLQTISLLGCTIAKRDSDTDAHNYRVSIYSVRLAEAIGLDVETIRSLIKGAFLHDVGKIGFRDNILLKPGKLDEQEFAVMKTHV